MRRLIRYLWITGWYSFAIFLVLSAVSLSAARYLLPYANKFNKEIEIELSTLTGQPVKIGGLDAEWRGLGPKLVIKDVKLINSENGDTIAQFDKAFLGFDLYSLIVDGQLGLRNISISGINLYIERSEDGQLSIGGMGRNNGDNSAVDNEKLAQWILGQVKLEIEHANIYWHNRQLKTKPVRFSNVELTLKNKGNRHQLKATVLLPEALGKQLTIAADVFGDPFHADTNRRGQVYLKAEKLNLPAFTDDQFTDKFMLNSLDVDFELWGTWSQGRLSKLTGDINASSIQLARKTPGNIKKTLKLKNIAGKLLWQSIDNGWQLDINNFIFNRAGKSWPDTKFTLKSNTLTPGKNSDIEAELGYLRIEDMVYLSLFADLDDNKRTALSSRNPDGNLKDTYLHYVGTDPDKPQLAFETNFNNLTLLPVGPAPGIRGLSGSIITNNTSGSVALDTNNAFVYLPNVLREPLPVDNLNGLLNWEKSETSWKISSNNLQVKNEDLNTRLKLEFDLPFNGSSPFLNLTAVFKDGKADNIQRYVPFRAMPTAAIEWIDRSIKGGNIESGSALFHGRLADLPFDKGEGIFSVLVHANNATIDYAPGWPPLKELVLDLEFLNRGVEVKGHAGKIFSSDLYSTVVQINDLLAHPAILKVKGKVKGETKDKLEYLRVAPKLKASFEDTLSELTMSGQSLLELDLSIPLSSNGGFKTRINGKVELQKNTLNIKGALGTLWTDLNGILQFSDDTLSANELTGQFFNHPAKLEIKTKHREKQSVTQFRTESIVSPGILIARFIPSWSKRIQGDTHWTVKLDIPHKSNASPVKPVIRIQTDLENIGIDLPAPLNKVPDEKRLLNITTILSKDERTFKVKYGRSISSVIQFASNNEEISLKRGKININSGKIIDLPPTGIRITGKDIKQFSYDDWVSVTENTPEFSAGKNAGPLTWLSSIKANIHELTAFGQTYNSVYINATNAGKKWKASVSSKELSGNITLPIDLSTAPIAMKLDKLILYPKPGEAESSDPREWPAMIINSKRFVFDDTEYGSLLLSTSKRRNGLFLDYFELARPINKITGTGSWTYNGKKHSSSIKVKSESIDIGKTMAAMGYADTIKNGDGTFAMELNWPDMPQNVSKKIINGSVKIDFSDGQLLDISPGAGRIFGLLSLQALPRRLTLDFSDVFSKGFSFEKIQGDFNIDAGDAYTSNFQLNGHAALINISGRVGLVDEDYDQLVTVIPDAASGVPILTILAGAEPITAAVVWTLKSIFQSQIDEAVTFQYTITGSWDHPKVVKIPKPESRTHIEDDEEEP